MAQVSRQQLNPKTKELIDQLFMAAFTQIPQPKIKSLLPQIFTYTEKVMIAKRLAIAFLINQGQTYRAISHQLKVSTATVMRIRTLLRQSDSGLAEVVSQLTQQTKSKENMGDFISQLLQGKSGHHRELLRSMSGYEPQS